MNDDAGSELASVNTIVSDAQEMLIKKERAEGRNPADHDLLRHLFINNDVGGEKAWQALLRRFSNDPSHSGNVLGVPELAYAVDGYLNALETALEEQNLSAATETKPITSGPPFPVPGFTDADIPY